MMGFLGSEHVFWGGVGVAPGQMAAGPCSFKVNFTSVVPNMYAVIK